MYITLACGCAVCSFTNECVPIHIPHRKKTQFNIQVRGKNLKKILWMKRCTNKLLFARAIFCVCEFAFVQSLDDLSCPYETRLSLCMRLLELLLLLLMLFVTCCYIFVNVVTVRISIEFHKCFWYISKKCFGSRDLHVFVPVEQPRFKYICT